MFPKEHIHVLLENIEQELSNLSKQVKECDDNQIEVKAMLQHIVQQSTSSSMANVARLDGVICRPSKADNKHLEELSVELCINVLEEHRLGGKNLDGKKVWELVKDAAYNQAKKADRQFPNITFSKLDGRF
ncbi:Phosphoserine transaminase [Mucor velutinosus]|uniref:Phosphoserine transaminase n=1 Tax=Mucor velutinosus TaxID=708070 RepID=A0AAN7D4S1_9FUNG|nr:Phosphoserine transaminase [Mucor velutinosus]